MEAGIEVFCLAWDHAPFVGSTVMVRECFTAPTGCCWRSDAAGARKSLASNGASGACWCPCRKPISRVAAIVGALYASSRWRSIAARIQCWGFETSQRTGVAAGYGGRSLTPDRHVEVVLVVLDEQIYGRGDWRSNASHEPTGRLGLPSRSHCLARRLVLWRQFVPGLSRPCSGAAA